MDQNLPQTEAPERDFETDLRQPAGGAGKSSVTSRLSSQVVFRVADPETARAFGEALAGNTRIARAAAQAAGARDANGVADGAEAAVERASSSSGAPLPTHLQRQFEGSLGADLSGVRIHTGAASAEAASAVGAKAYTVGNDIHFAEGRYAPADPFGVHLLAHEVAHTVQQSGGAQRRQHKLEVSTPHDAAEHEADRAADAMVAGRPAALAGVSVAVHRTEDDYAKELAKEGEKEAVETNKQKPSTVLQVSNVRDTASAEALMKTLLANETLLQQGVSQGEVQGSALSGNGKVIADLQLYLGAASQQSVSTSNFQQHYAKLLRDFGRLENMFKKYAGTSVKDIKSKEDAEGAVATQTGAAGHDTGDLKALFEKLKQDPLVKTQIDGVQTAVSGLSGMPEKVETQSSKASTAMGSVHTGTMKLRSATNAECSNELKTTFAEAKKKAEAAEGLAGKVMGALGGGAKAGFDKATKTSTETGPWGAQFEKAAAGFGSEAALAALGTGGLALAGVAADTMWKLLKPMVDKLMTELDISVGKFPDKRDETAAAKNDSAVYEAARAAAEDLRLTKKTLGDTFKEYFAACDEMEKKQADVKRKMELLGQTLQQMAKKKGMGAEGKALAEMTTFVGEAQTFVTQAETVYKIGTSELDAKNKDQAPAVARARVNEFNKASGREVYMAYKWYGKKSGGAPGEQAEHIGVNPVHVTIDTATNSKSLDTSPEERRGKGSADSRFDGDLGANGVIADAVKNVKELMIQADAYAKAVNSLVFGNALSPAAAK